MTRLIWLSDVHYMHEGTINGHDTRQRLAAALALVAEQYSDADSVVITGDLTEHGRDEDYADLARLFAACPIPVHCLTGNHDVPANMERHLPPPEGAMDGFRQFTVSFGDDVLIALDTWADLDGPGQLCSARLAWLAETLERHSDARVLVAMHHPPVPLGLVNQDPDRVVQGDAVMAMLRDHGQVAQVMCGHVHRPISTMVEGIGVTSLRSLAYQAPGLRPDWTWDSFAPAPEATGYCVVDLTPRAITFHQHEIWLADFDGRRS